MVPGSERLDTTIRLPVEPAEKELWTRFSSGVDADRIRVSNPEGEAELSFYFQPVIVAREPERIFDEERGESLARYPQVEIDWKSGQVVGEFQLACLTKQEDISGWRQVLAEAVTAYEEGRFNVAVLLANVAFETFYSSIVDPQLAAKGIPDDIVREMHLRLQLNTRLRQGFARPLGLPFLSDAPFWSDWRGEARGPRGELAHRWQYKKNQPYAARSDALRALSLHIRSILHLDASSLDSIIWLDAQRISP